MKEKTKSKCSDPKCPSHGTLRVRGRIFSGTVVSNKMAKTVSVEWERRCYIPKFERYSKRKTRIKAHLPECVSVNVGDKVRIGETRKLSKTKSFVVIEVLK